MEEERSVGRIVQIGPHEFVREIQADPENFEKSRKTMNVLCDTIETVAPFLVDEILACDKSGHKIRWLNPNKIMGRMIKGMIKKRPDQFEPFGL